MGFLDGKNKKLDGFHVVVEILDSMIDFSVVLVDGKNYGELARVSLTHRILPINGLTEIEISSIEAMLAKGFIALSEESKKKSGKKNKVKIESATVILSGGWFAMNREDNLQIGNPGQNNLISKKTIEEALRAGGDSVIEAFVDAIKLNGYEVANPIGKKAKNVTASAHFYSVDAALLAILKKEVGFHTGREPKVMTFPKACSLFAALYGMELPALFVSVERQTTFVYVVSKVFFNQSLFSNFPAYSGKAIDVGLNQITKVVMDKSGGESQVAASYMRLLDEDMLGDSATLLVKSAFEEAVQDWKSKVLSAIMEVSSPGKATARKLVLCRDRGLVGIFLKVLGQDFEPADIEQLALESSLYNV